MEVRIYQTPNLLKFIKAVDGPENSNSNHMLTNLVENFDSRTNNKDLKPIINIDLE